MADDRIGIAYAINLGSLRTSINSAKKHLSDFHSWVEKTSKSVSGKGTVAGASAELKKLGITSNMTARDIKNLNLSTLDMQRAFDLTKARMRELTKEVAGGGKASQVAAKEYKQLQTRMPELEHEANRGKKAFGDYRRAMDRWGEGFKYMIASQAAWIASGMVLFGVIRQIGQGLKDVITTHQELKMLAAITQANAQEMFIMEDAIRRASVGTKFFAADMTKAAVVMAQAGFSAREIAESISAVSVLASATGRDLTEVADLMTTIIRAYELDTSESLRVVNALAAGISKSKLQIDTLRTAFNYMAVASHQFNISIEDTISWLGVLRDRGLKATTIGTSFRGVLATLVKETKKFSDTLKGLPDGGLAFSDVTIRRGRDLADAMKLLAERGFDISDAFAALPRRTAMTFALMVKNVDAFEKLKNEITGTNTAIDMNIITMQGMASQLAQTKSIFDEFMLSITRSGGDLEPFVAGIKLIVQVMASGIITIGTFINLLMKAVAEIALLGEMKARLPSGPTAEDPFAPETSGAIENLEQIKGAYRAYQEDIKNTIEKYTKAINRIVGKEGLFGNIIPKDIQNIKELNKSLTELYKKQDDIKKQMDKVGEGKDEWQELRNELLLVNAQIKEVELSLKLTGTSIFGAAKNMQDIMMDLALNKDISPDQFLGIFRKGTDDLGLMQKAADKLGQEFRDAFKEWKSGDLSQDSEEFEHLKNTALLFLEALKKIGVLQKRISSDLEKDVAESEKDLKKALKDIDKYFKDEEKLKKSTISKLIQYEKDYRNTEWQLLKQAKKNELEEAEYREWLAGAEFEREKQRISERIKLLEKLKRELEIKAVEHPALAKEITQIDALIAKYKELEPIKKEALSHKPEDITGGIKKGFDDALTEIKDQYELWKRITKDTFLEMRDTMSDVFFDAMTGELKTASDYWRAFTNTVKRYIADMAAQWVMARVMGGMGGGISWLDVGMTAMGAWGGTSGDASAGLGADWAGTNFHGGGLVKKYHSGGLKSNELLSILKNKEFVINDSATRSIGVQNLDYMNRTGQMPEKKTFVTNNRYYYIDAIDPQSLDQVLKTRGAGAIQEVSLSSFSVAKERRDPRVSNMR